MECLHKAIHDRSGLPIVVAQENCKAADPLDQRCHIGFSELFPELDQIALPMPELLAIGDYIRAAQDVELGARAFPRFSESARIPKSLVF